MRSSVAGTSSVSRIQPQNRFRRTAVRQLGRGGPDLHSLRDGDEFRWNLDDGRACPVLDPRGHRWRKYLRWLRRPCAEGRVRLDACSGLRGCGRARHCQRPAVPDDVGIDEDGPCQWPDESAADRHQLTVGGYQGPHLVDQRRNGQPAVQPVETVKAFLIRGLNSFAGVQEFGNRCSHKCRLHSNETG